MPTDTLSSDAAPAPLVGAYDALYLGSVPVRSDSGSEVAEQAVRHIVAMALPRRPVEIRVTTAMLQVADKKSGDVLKSVSLSQVSFVAVHLEDSCVLSFFSHENVTRLTVCHAVRTATSKLAKQLLLVLNESFRIQNGEVSAPRTQKEIKRHMSNAGSKKNIQRKTSATNLGRELARYETVWLGAAYITDRTPSQIRSEDALGMLQYSMGNAPPRKAVVIVTESRIAILDALDNATILLETLFNRKLIATPVWFSLSFLFFVFMLVGLFTIFLSSRCYFIYSIFFLSGGWCIGNSQNSV